LTSEIVSKLSEKYRCENVSVYYIDSLYLEDNEQEEREFLRALENIMTTAGNFEPYDTQPSIA